MGEVYRARDPRLSREVALSIAEGRDTLDYVYAGTLLETLGELKQPAASTGPGARHQALTPGTEPRHQASGTGTF